MAKKSSWVKYRGMGGPRFRGTRENTYDPAPPFGIWSQILGVVARCEGKHDTVVMYDETGVTAGAFQWTFKSGRLQKLLEFFKSVPIYDFTEGHDRTLFDEVCMDGDKQIFERFNFRITGGKFVDANSGRPLRASNKKQQKVIVDICMGRRSLESPAKQRQFALALCNLFVDLFQNPEVQAASIEYAKHEFKRSLDYVRPPLKSVGGTIRCLLPDEVWGTPIPAIFFNLFQNAPAGAFRLFKNAMKTAEKKGLVKLTKDGYVGVDVSNDPEIWANMLLEIIWLRLNATAYADWGFRSKQYLSSGGKNPPRIKRIRPAIQEFYGINLPYHK